MVLSQEIERIIKRYDVFSFDLEWKALFSTYKNKLKPNVLKIFKDQQGYVLEQLVGCFA